MTAMIRPVAATTRSLRDAFDPPARDETRDLCSPDPEAREHAWAAFYPRARSIAAARLRSQFGLRPGRDDQDADEAVDAAMGLLYRRCLKAGPDNPVRDPYNLLVGISVHLLPRSWRRRQRERLAREKLARLRSLAVGVDDERAEFASDTHAVRLAQWLLDRLDERREAMPRELAAGVLGALFRSADLAHLLDEALAPLPDARRMHCRLYHVEGLSTTSIARLCGCGPSNVSNNLRRCWRLFNHSRPIRIGLGQIAEGRTAEAVPELAVVG